MGKKKEKVIYVDDGRTIADMSGVSGPRLSNRNPARPSPSFKEVWKTYWNAVKQMVGPMITVMCALGVIYMIIYFIFLLAY